MAWRVELLYHRLDRGLLKLGVSWLGGCDTFLKGRQFVMFPSRFFRLAMVRFRSVLPWLRRPY